MAELTDDCRRALQGFTDAKTGLPMEDIGRVAVWVCQRLGDVWEEPQGHLFHTGCGVFQYIAGDGEDDRDSETFFVQFVGERTAEKDVVVKAHVWSPPSSRPEEPRRRKFGQR